MTSVAQPPFPYADDIILFASLQSQISCFEPPANIGEDVAVAGRIYQMAMHLYLLTTLHGLPQTDGSHQAFVKSCTSRAMGYLDELTVTARINTSLCRPIAIIGCYLLMRRSRIKCEIA